MPTTPTIGQPAPQFGGDVFQYQQPTDPNQPLNVTPFEQPPLPAPTPGQEALTGLQQAPTVQVGTGDAAQTPQVLQGLQQAPTAGLLGTNEIAQNLLNATQGINPSPLVAPILTSMQEQQARALDNRRQGLAVRGVLNSTPGQGELDRLQMQQQGQLAQTQANLQSQLLPTQVNALTQLDANQRANRQQQTGELFGSLGLGEQLQQGQYGRDMGSRQQQVAELLGSLQAGEQLQQGAYGRGLLSQQQGAAEEGQRFSQQQARQAQDLNNWFRFMQSQQQLDTMRQQQQAQSIALMLNALGMGTITPQMPTFNIPNPQPGAGAAIGGLAGNVATAAAGSNSFWDKFF